MQRSKNSLNNLTNLLWWIVIILPDVSNLIQETESGMMHKQDKKLHDLRYQSVVSS